MAAVWYRLRAELRTRWAPSLALALLVAVGTATVLTAVAGARRTASVGERYQEATRTNHTFLELSEENPALLDDIERLPGVETVGRLAFVFVLVDTDEFIPFVASTDGRYGRTVDRYPIVAGHRADPRAADEVVLSEATARGLDLQAGSRLQLRSFAPDQAAALEGEDQDVRPAGPDVTLTVVGISRTGNDLALRSEDLSFSVLTPAFYERYRDRIITEENLAAVRLRGGADAVPDFRRRVRDLPGAAEGISIEPSDTAAEGIEDSIQVLTTGLVVFAAVAAMAALVAVTVVLGRQAFLVAADDPALAALGMTRVQRWGVAVASVVPAALGGAALGALGAILASPIMPVGVAGRAELEPGLDVDPSALALGVLAAIALVSGAAALATWRESGRATAPSTASRPGFAAIVGRRLASAGPAATTGIRMALEPGQGRTAVPVLPALAGAAAGIAAVIGVLGFGAALDRLAVTPERYGWGWDVDVVDADVDASRRDPDVEAVALGRFQIPLAVDGRPVTAQGTRNLAGEAFPTVLEGRPARGPDEIVLGTDTLALIDRDVGDTVTAEGPSASRRLRVVGRGIFPSPEDPFPLADGAALTFAGLDALGLADGSREEQSFTQHLVRWAGGVDEDAARARLARDYEVVTPSAPPEVDKLTQVNRLPQVLALFLASVAVLAVGYALVTGVHRRRRDLAVLETLGFVGRQVSGTVAWQASTIAVIGLVAGVPLGLVIGRWTWALIADSIGVATDPAIPVAAVLLALPVAVLVANLIAFVPGRIAARTRPAVVLRAE